MSEVGKDYVFIHIFKCAGNSVKTTLRGFDKTSKQPVGAHTDMWALHTHYENKGKLDELDSKFKFIIVRNPYDWLASTYYYIKRSGGHPFSRKLKKMSVSRFVDWYIDEAMNLPRKEGQNRYLTQKQFITRDRDIHGEVLIDHVAKVEQLAEDWKVVCGKIGLKNTKLPMKNKNPQKKSSYRKEFDEKALKRIQETFAEDFIYFGYDT